MWIGLAVTFFILLTVITIIILLVRAINKIKLDIPPNSPLIWNLDTSKSGGFSTGVLAHYHSTNFRDRKIISMRPLDVPYDDKGKAIEQENIEFAFRIEKSIELPPGALSRHRGNIIIMPESASDLDERFRNTPLGIAFSSAIELMEFKDKAIDIMRKRQTSERSAIKLLEDEEHKIITTLENRIKDFTKSQITKIMPGEMK